MSDGFLSRWARRKEAMRVAEQVPAPLEEAAAPAPDAVPGAEASAPASAAPLAEGGEGAPIGEETRTLLDTLPPLDALTPQSDLTPFLQAGVPTALRNAALRRIWSLDPAIRDFVSEACEYAYDWNTPGGVPGLGPLLPGDDVKAMLGRLFRDPADPAQADEFAAEAEPADPPPADSPCAAPEEPRAVAADEPPAPDADEAAQPAAISAESVAATVVEPGPARPRLRRHGGAMPA